MSLTLSTCWYNFKCKYDIQNYHSWIDFMLSNVNNYYLVVYSDIESSSILEKYVTNTRIKLVILSHKEFYNYQYKEYWIKNHEKNVLLNQSIDWKVNMLWCEKVHFVYRTFQNRYFDTEMYGWCDIGYFRNKPGEDLDKESLRKWPNAEKVNGLDKTRIHYSFVNPDHSILNWLVPMIQDKNEFGLPKHPIPPEQKSIGGGFFLCHPSILSIYIDLFDTKLKLYFQHDYLVKDDQMIIADCVFSNDHLFNLHIEECRGFNIWFSFQRILSEFPTICIEEKVKKRISILMPIKNGIEFIEESIPSILAQKYTEWELIIAINGLPPNSKEYQIARTYQSSNTKIHVLDFYHIQGKANTLNAMLPYCNYDYIALLDVDDIWHPFTPFLIQNANSVGVNE